MTDERLLALVLAPGDLAQALLFAVTLELECAVEQAVQDLAALSFERVGLGVFP